MKLNIDKAFETQSVCSLQPMRAWNGMIRLMKRKAEIYVLYFYLEVGSQ